MPERRSRRLVEPGGITSGEHRDVLVSKSGFGQRVLRQARNLFGGAAALAADAERQHRRVKHQRIGIGWRRTIGDDDAQIAFRCPLHRAGTQPFGAASFLDQRDRAAGQQRGGDRFDVFGIGDAPAGRRLVERKAEA